jgi:hypothetical protein
MEILMVRCCQRTGDIELNNLLPADSTPPVRKGIWEGRLIEFHCAGLIGKEYKKAIAGVYLVVVAVTAIASYWITQSALTPKTNKTLIFGIPAVLYLAQFIGYSLAFECANYRCSKPRACFSPAIIITAALVASSATVLFIRENAQNELISYFKNQRVDNQTIDSAYPYHADQLLSKTDGLLVPLISSTITSAVLTTFYEVYAAGKHLNYN